MINGKIDTNLLTAFILNTYKIGLANERYKGNYSTLQAASGDLSVVACLIATL